MRPEHYEAVRDLDDDVEYHRDARIVSGEAEETVKARNAICVVTAGTSDLPVAEEAALTAEVLGNKVVRVYDAASRDCTACSPELEPLIAPMPSSPSQAWRALSPASSAVFVDCPVIGVPTSVGYGASFHGISALLSMLNSCASGVSVVNIDNGFGAGYIASQINHTGFAAYKEEEKMKILYF